MLTRKTKVPGTAFVTYLLDNKVSFGIRVPVTALIRIIESKAFTLSICRGVCRTSINIMVLARKNRVTAAKKRLTFVVKACYQK